MLEPGVSPSGIVERLGHSRGHNVRFLFRDIQKEAAISFEDALFRR